MLFLGCIIISFLILWSIFLSLFLVHFKNGPLPPTITKSTSLYSQKKEGTLTFYADNIPEESCTMDLPKDCANDRKINRHDEDIQLSEKII